MSGTGSSGRDRYFETVLDAARWVAANISTCRRRPGPVGRGDVSLYSGIPGPILFFLELHRYTSDAAWLDRALAEADDLITTIDDNDDPGLYTGLAGVGFTLGTVFRVTADRKCRHGVERCVERIGRLPQHETDVYGGASGTGLFLLWAARELEFERARMLAIDAGRRLVDVAAHDAAPRFPNFSHGTSGIAYFLATLAQSTRDEVFLQAARECARRVLEIADTDDGGCVVRHDDDPDGRQLYDLGWCHGPAGTARLFYRLYAATKDRAWLTLVCGSFI